MAKSPGQAQRENATTPHADNVSVTIESLADGLHSAHIHVGIASTEYLYLMQRHLKRESRSTRAVCDLTGDSTRRESVNMHNEENYVGVKAMC